MIESAQPRSDYTGNGVATTFAYTFPVTSKNNVLVTKTLISSGASTTSVVDVDYTVNGVSNASSAAWTITMPISGAAISSLYRITITPNLSLKQLTDFENQGGFNADTHESSFDYLTIVAQQIQEQVDRAVKLGIGSTDSADAILTSIDASKASCTASASAAATSATAAATSATAAATSATASATSATASAASAASASAIAAGVLTTKGDTVGFSTVVARLAVGTNNQVLTADSAQTLGVKWATPTTPTFDSLAPTTTEGDLIYRSATVNTRLAKGTTLQQLRMNAGATAPEWFTGSTGGGDVIIVSDVKASGTAGGTATTGSFQTRTIQTEDADTGNNCTIAANQITLLAGTYRCVIQIPFYSTAETITRLRNITDSTTTVNGSSLFHSAFGHSFIVGRFTIAASKTFEIQYWATSGGGGTNGLGYVTSLGSEVYTRAIFWKE